MTKLTEAEVEAITAWHGPETYTCACDSRCPSLPCNNDRDDLVTTVQRIIDTRLAPIRALAEDWAFADGDTPPVPYRALADLLAALDAPVSASQDHDGAEGQSEGERAGEGDWSGRVWTGDRSYYYADEETR